METTGVQLSLTEEAPRLQPFSKSFLFSLNKSANKHGWGYLLGQSHWDGILEGNFKIYFKSSRKCGARCVLGSFNIYYSQYMRSAADVEAPRTWLLFLSHS